MTDTVIEEIHETRRAISEKFHGNTAAIAADAAARQSASGRPVWHATTPNKRLQPIAHSAARFARSTSDDG